MPEVTLTISAGNRSRRTKLNPEGTIVGRSASCDVVIDSADVSRQHARVFQDPFGRWIVEDLGSSNGTFVSGVRVHENAILPGETIAIGPALLSIDEPADARVNADASIEISNIVVKDFGMEVFYAREELGDPSARPCPDILDEITERLAEVKGLPALYPEVCRCLARAPRTAAAVLRLPEKGTPMPETPDVLACHFGTSPGDTVKQVASDSYPSHLAFRVSRRVLDAARSHDRAVMAKSVYSPDDEVTVALVDEHSPRATICAPLGAAAGEIDLLYVDVPIEQGFQAGPEEMFALVCLVAQKVASARKSLAPIHARSERRALDHELELAHQLQIRLAPTLPPDLGQVEVAVVYRPVIWVGGDFCDVWTLDDGRLAFALGHVLDKGLPAAIGISNLRVLLRTTLSLSGEFSDVLKHVSSHLIASCPAPISASLFLGLFDSSTGVLDYVNVGHPEPIITHPRTGFKSLGSSEGTLLGSADLRVPARHEPIAQGATTVVVSRGILEARSPDKGKFGLERLTNVLRMTASRSAREIGDSILKAVKDFQRRIAQTEDFSIIVLSRR